MGTGTVSGERGERTSEGLVSAVYQPVVELASGEVVGYEALARGPRGGELERPDALLGAARRAGLVEQVDWECRLAAVSGALDAGLDAAATLFVNVEPEALGSVSETDRASSPELWRRAEERLSLAVELPATALRSRPAELVRAAAACRERGWTVVLDDVGSDHGSLALLGLVAPDVIKLDLRLAGPAVADRPAFAEVVTAAWAEQERTGAAIVAEGIETEAQLEVARGLGATLGQGWLWGRPAALPDSCGTCRPSGLGPADRGAAAPAGQTPWALVSAAREPREARTPRLAAISRHLERRARTLGPGAIVLGAFGASGSFEGRVRSRYRDLVADAALVGVLGAGIAETPANGVHGTDLAADDPLRTEWCVSVLAPHFAAALVAQDLGDDAADDDERRFRFVLTHDRELVIGVTRALLSRLT